MFEILFCVVVTLLVKYFYSRRRIYELASKFPGPIALPIVGNAHYLMWKDLVGKLKTLDSLNKEFGSLFRFWNWQQLEVFTTDPAVAKIIWEKNLIYERRPQLKTLLSPLVGDGIITTNDFDKWRKHKRIIMPNFHSKVVSGYVDTFGRNSRKLVDKLTDNAGEGPVYVTKLLRDCAVYSVYETTTGSELDDQLLEKINESFTLFHDVFAQRNKSFLLYNEKILNMTKLAEQQRKSTTFIRNMMLQFVEKKLDQFEESSTQDDPKGVCTIDLLIRNSLKDKAELLDEVITIFNAGIDTTGATTPIILSLLGEHQTVIQETLRLYPTIPYMGLIIKEELPLQKGLTIPEDTFVVLSVYGLHRNPELYPEPDRFNPERFALEKNAGRNPYSYMPFGRGRTTCIGSNYALASMKTLVSTLVRRLRVAEVVGGMEGVNRRLQLGGLLVPSGGKDESLLSIVRLLRMISEVLVCVTVVLFAKYFFARRRTYELAAKFPGPTPLPIIGNWHCFAFKDYTSVFKILNAFNKQFGCIYRVWKWDSLEIHTTDPTLAKIIWEKNLIYERRPQIKTLLSPLVGDGLITTNDLEKWKKNKRAIMPNFHSKVVQGYVDIFGKNSRMLVEELIKFGEMPTNVSKLLRDFALSSIFETTTGAELDAGLQEEMNKSFIDFYSVYVLRLENFLLFNEKILNLTKLAEQQTKAVSFIRGIISEFVSKKLKEFNSSSVEEFSNRESRCAIEMLIQSSLRDEVELLDEVMTIFNAGIDTTGVSMGFLLSLLGEHQNVQEKVYQEQKEIFADDIARPVTKEDLKKMVIQESLRLYPTVPFLGVVVKEKIALGEGLVIPEDTFVALSVFGMHRDPKFFPEPETFMPERFLPENHSSRHTDAYMPFGRGRTTCIGSNYATMALKTATSTLVRRLRVAQTVGGVKGIEQRLRHGVQRMWLETIICVAVTLLAKYFFSKRRLHDLAAQFAGPKSLPILGTLHHFMFKDFIGIFHTLNSFNEQYGGIFRLWNWQNLQIITTDPSVAKIIWEKNLIYERRPQIKILQSQVLGDGIVTTSDLEKWKKNKRMIMPNFHAKVVHGYLDTFNKYSVKLVLKLTDLAQEGLVKIEDHTLDTAFQTVFETTTGIELSTQLRIDFMEHFNVVHKVFDERFEKPWLLNETIFNWTKLAEEQTTAANFIRDTFLEIVDKKLKEYEETGPEDAATGQSLDSIELLIRSSLTDRAMLLDEAITLLRTGFETTWMANNFLLGLLAEHQTVQDKVYDEQKQLFADDINRKVTSEDLKKMVYLDQVIHESLRLYPILPFMGVIVKEEIPLGKGLIIPEDAHVILSVYGLHRNPELYPEPERFDPERFSPEKNALRNPYSYMPFGRGRTTCVGTNYALASMKTFISTLVRHLRVVEIVGGMKGVDRRLKHGGMLRPMGGFTLRFAPREEDQL
ncbi:hypothetical protein C0J52_15700 [Blattella germanica]|nr:hypothetical protein C0J52_15700 [Blattella germanica]